jgi:hypothetical protein
VAARIARRLVAAIPPRRAVRRQPRAVEIRTVAGPLRALQWVLSGGPYTVASHVRHVQVVCPPP